MSIFKSIILFLVLHMSPAECSVLYPKAGTELTIQCDGVPPNHDVDWKFNNERILFINGRTGAKRRGSRYPAGSTKYYPTTYSLRISQLERSDSGLYSCSHERVYTVRVVSVSVKPGPVLPQFSDAELHCDVEGDPKAEVKWLRPNAQPYPERKQIINLKSVTSDDDGQWTCQVENSQINIALTVVGGGPLPKDISETVQLQDILGKDSPQSSPGSRPSVERGPNISGIYEVLLLQKRKIELEISKLEMENENLKMQNIILQYKVNKRA